MKTSEARQLLTVAGYVLGDRPSKHFDNEIVVSWPTIGAVGVLCERNAEVDVGEVELFVANAAKRLLADAGKHGRFTG